MTKTQKRLFIIIPCAVVGFLFTLLICVATVALGRSIGKIEEANNNDVIFYQASSFILNDDQFEEKYGKPISVVDNDSVVLEDDGKYTVYCTVKNEDNVVYEVVLSANTEEDPPVFTYVSVVITPSSL